MSSNRLGDTILYGIAGAISVFIVSSALHENIEFYRSQEEERNDKPKTEEQLLVQELLNMRRENALQKPNK